MAPSSMEPCPKCEKPFELRNLVTHLKCVHKVNEEGIQKFRQERKSKKKPEGHMSKFKYVCPICKKNYSQPCSLRKHMLKKHEAEKGKAYDVVSIETGLKEKKMEYLCDVCHTNFTKKEFLEKHRMKCHSDLYPEESSRIEFADVAKFQDWWSNLQKYSGTSFVKKWSYELKDGSKRELFRCHREGNHVPEATDRVGTISKKVVSKCDSFGKITFWPDGSVTVLYNIEHSHELNFAILKFTQDDVEYLIRELKKKKTDKDIINQVRETCSPKLKLYYLTRDDLRNIKERYGMYDRRHKDDLVSVRMAAEQDPEILRFRPPKDPSGESFAMTIITDKQQTWLRKYGSRGICIDDTYNITQYNLRLCTVLTIDDNDRMRPSAFFISHGLTSTDVEEFFVDIRKVVPEMSPEYFMSDEANQLYNGFLKANPHLKDTTTRLFCHFHVLQAWKRQARKILKDEQIPFVMKWLVLALKSKDKVVSEKAILQLLSFCDQTEEGKRFSEYYKRNYEQIKALWASCEREYSPFNTSSMAESWHAYLKNECLRRRQNIRLDFLLSLLKTAVDEIDHRRSVEEAKGLSERHSRRAETNRNHLQMVKSSDNFSLSQKENGEYELMLESKISLRLKKRESGCPCVGHKKTHCRFCQLCPYSISCSCSESRPGVGCAHMHYVHEFVAESQNVDAETENAENSSINSRDVDDTEENIAQHGRQESARNDANCDRIACHLNEMRDADDDGMETDMARDKSKESEENGPDPSQNQSIEVIDEIVEVEQIVNDNKKIKLNELLQQIDVFSQIIVHAHKQTDQSDFDSLNTKFTALLCDVKEEFPSLVPRLATRTAVAMNAKIQDKTMRERFGMQKRKKKQMPLESWNQVVAISDDHISVCYLCKNREPRNSEDEIRWLGCKKCKIWVHELCANSQSRVCLLCSGFYIETETLLN